MNSIADMGGMHGFGPVISEGEVEPVFHEDWERRVCCVNLAIWFGGAWCADETRNMMESMEPSHYLSSSYYEHWLYFMETLLVKKGVVTQQELEAGHLISSGKGSTLITPIKKQDCWPAFRAGGSIAMPTNATQRFQEGDRVKGRNINPEHHTRLPRYARGRKGTVARHLGSFGFADSRAQGLGNDPQHMYTVRFEGEELWGPDAGPCDAVYLDLYDSYLDPVA
ncbi:Nitrile hydratase subunit beta [Variovorax sp. SRS16]|uniref:nitrile hydratase subunit beta n=1 Tax=Variovorax sp. SRS16 TaxID=282217 RepID=UPI001315BF41|nr:nitrile hydratase subunit beta [Variovorax sp. SRS16]VTU31151.1 Nitrile hydratase subunit beta [Variovorax sp. SRS16]